MCVITVYFKKFVLTFQACAQLWKDLSDQSNRIERPVGRCHDISHNFNSIETDKRIRYNSYYSNGYSYGMALIGTVAVPTDVSFQYQLQHWTHVICWNIL